MVIYHTDAALSIPIPRRIVRFHTEPQPVEGGLWSEHVIVPLLHSRTETPRTLTVSLGRGMKPSTRVFTPEKL